MPAIHNPSGTLSVYGLACGYVEVAGPYGPHDYEARLWHEGCYHVRITSPAGYVRTSWECFDSLTDARRYLSRAATALRSGDPDRITPFLHRHP